MIYDCPETVRILDTWPRHPKRRKFITDDRPRSKAFTHIPNVETIRDAGFLARYYSGRATFRVWNLDKFKIPVAFRRGLVTITL